MTGSLKDPRHYAIKYRDTVTFMYEHNITGSHRHRCTVIARHISFIASQSRQSGFVGNNQALRKE